MPQATFIQEDWTTIDGFQRTRGVLKLMAKVIYRLWKDDNKDLMILPGSLPLHDGSSRNELTYYFPVQSDCHSIKEAHATGIFAVGLSAKGIFAAGVLARGIVTFGVGSFGVVSVGVCSIGLLFAAGTLAVAPIAFGVLAIGIVAGGVGAFGWKVLFSVA